MGFFNDGSFAAEEMRKYPVFGSVRQPTENAELLGTLCGGEKRQAVSGVDINLEQAWKTYGNGNHDTIVAMIDTGIDYTHEDLKDTLWVNTDEIPEMGSMTMGTDMWTMSTDGIFIITTTRSSPGKRTATGPTEPDDQCRTETGSELPGLFPETGCA